MIKHFQIIGIVLLVSVAIVMGTFSIPGMPLNRHEWLNDTMKQTAKNGLDASVDIGLWKNVPRLHEPVEGEAGRGVYWDMAESIHGEMAWTATFDVSKANYTFMKIRTPDNRCFVVDICLKHGETRLSKCNP